MTQFRDRSWNHRFQEMGDKAEGIFEQTIGRGFARFGLNRPPLAVHKLPAKIRYTPDFLTSDGLYEVQGCGRDGILKLKDEKLDALIQWDDDFRTHLWVYDQTNHRWSSVWVMTVSWHLDEFRRGTFPEGKAYWEIPTSWDKWLWKEAP